MRYKPRNSGELDTYVEIDGVEYEVSAHWEYQPAEEDTNTAEGIEVTGAYYQDEGDIMHRLSQEEEDALYMRVWDEVSGMGDDGYGDYLYEQAKDRKMEERG